MAIKKLNENPSIVDDVVIDIITPDANGCFNADPYRVDEVVIYYIQRDFVNGNRDQSEVNIPSYDLEQRLEAATIEACQNPTMDNLEIAGELQAEFDLTQEQNQFFFREAQIVKKIGSTDMPAWLSTDQDNAYLEHIDIDDNGEPLYGHFQYNWSPVGMREGSYFVSWTWTSLISGEKITRNIPFELDGSTQLTTSIPTHYTRENKYEILQERYTPDMFKMTLSPNDLSPLVIQELNNSVAKGFTVLENMTNQMVDLADANATHESLLQLLGNTFGLKLRSNDPTLWRRQIKDAIPLFKKKGTLNGLSDALSQAGINLKKYTRLWQVISPYTVQEAFDYTNSNTFSLSKVALPYDSSNFELYRRTANGDWTVVANNSASLDTSNGASTLTWLSTLNAGDSIRVVYLVNTIPSGQQSIETYIRKLPLADQRDERNQQYPLKNWNVRVIEEDDPLLDTIIPTRHPYHEPLVYGRLRTEFAYSENIYNMEEYNGSKRDSYQPCDIDKEFLDPCSQGLSSKFNVDLEIDNISNDRIQEATEIIREFTPFHAVLHSINLTGNINEFVKPPQEEVIALVQFNGEEITLSDHPQTIFNRTMTKTSQLRRDMLASMNPVVNNQNGTGINKEIALFSPDFNLNRVAVSNNPDLTLLEVLSPSANSGSYTVTDIDGHYAVIPQNVTEPINPTPFSFRLSNEILRKNASTAIQQIRKYYLKDSSVDFSSFNNILTQEDIDAGATGTPWKITIDSVDYDILDLNSDGSIEIESGAGLPSSTTSGIEYSLKNGSNVIVNSTNGVIKVSSFGRITLSGTLLVRGNSTSSLTDVRNLIAVGNYMLLDDGVQYKIVGFESNDPHVVYIEKYNGGDSNGNTVIAYQRIVDNSVGYFVYRGLQLLTTTDYEDEITNGNNHLLLIGTDYYAIASVDGTTITLEGPHKNWKTTGTAVTFSLLEYEKTPFEVPERSNSECKDMLDIIALDPKTKGTWTFSVDDGTEVIQIIGAGNAGEAYAEFQTLKVENMNKPVELTGTFCPSSPIVTTPGHNFTTGVDRSGQEVIEVTSGTVSAQVASKYLNTSGKDQAVDSISHSENISFKIERRP